MRFVCWRFCVRKMVSQAGSQAARQADRGSERDRAGERRPVCETNKGHVVVRHFPRKGAVGVQRIARRVAAQNELGFVQVIVVPGLGGHRVLDQEHQIFSHQEHHARASLPLFSVSLIPEPCPLPPEHTL